MAKQIHIRVDDDIYKELSTHSTVSGQSIQDCLSVAIRQFLVKVKEEPIHKGDSYKFIDLFAGIGGMRIAYENAGAQLVREASAKTNTVAGDGCQPWNEKVLSPKGWILFRDIKVGDEIFGSDGKVQTVLKVYDKEDRDIYKVYF